MNSPVSPMPPYHWLLMVLYGLATALYVAGLVAAGVKRARLQRAFMRGATVVFVCATLTLIGSLVYRGIEVRHYPWQTIYETLLVFSGSASLVYLVWLCVYRIEAFGALAGGLVMATLTYAWLATNPEGGHLPPVLRSFWFSPHVLTILVAYAASGVACLCAIVHVAQWLVLGPDRMARRTHDFDTYAYRLAVAGFPLLTIGLVLGCCWGQDAWADYWGWDAKEMAALITWLVFLVYFHCRRLLGWRGVRSSLSIILGFAVVIGTWLYSNQLPAAIDSLHEYDAPAAEQPVE